MNEYLDKTTPRGDCLVWTGAVNTDGYPRAVIDGNLNGKVHREVFRLVNGYLPEVVRHSCDEPLCINPAHLLGGSPTDNARDRHTRGRTAFQVTEQEAIAVRSLRKAKYSYKQIADIMKISPKRVEYICTRWSKGHLKFVG